MSRATPVVHGDYLYDPAQPDRVVRLDSPAWGSWLEAPTTTRFTYPLFDRRCGYIVGFMTVRKDRRNRGGTYWSVFRHRAGTMRRVYLGASPTVTQARLQAIADLLLEESRASTLSSASSGQDA